MASYWRGTRLAVQDDPVTRPLSSLSGCTMLGSNRPPPQCGVASVFHLLTRRDLQRGLSLLHIPPIIVLVDAHCGWLPFVESCFPLTTLHLHSISWQPWQPRLTGLAKLALSIKVTWDPNLNLFSFLFSKQSISRASPSSSFFVFLLLRP
jgi:hypothetical protein